MLSGGEKARLVMAKMLYDPPNFLVLDEPTNHLDMATKEMLINALAEFEGTMLFVSHDRAFLRGLSNRVLELGGEAEVSGFKLSYAEFRTLLAAKARVTVVSPAADAGSTTVQVWVQAQNPGERLRPGTAVRVAIVTATLPAALVVPIAALLPSAEGGVTVMVIGSDSVAHQKAVKTGVRDGGNVQILEGVSPGEQVVVVGGVGLEDGTKVKIEKPAEKSEEK